MIEYIIEEFTSPELWAMPTTSPTSEGKTLSIEEMNDNVFTLSLLLEGLGCLCESLGSSFDNYLITSLYPLTEKLGDRNPIISTSSFTTMQRISIICSYNSIANLIAKNTDYLIDTIIHHLKYLRFVTIKLIEKTIKKIIKKLREY